MAQWSCSYKITCHRYEIQLLTSKCFFTLYACLASDIGYFQLTVLLLELMNIHNISTDLVQTFQLIVFKMTAPYFNTLMQTLHLLPISFPNFNMHNGKYVLKSNQR